MNSSVAVPLSRIPLALTGGEFDGFLPEPLRPEAHQLFPDAVTLDLATVTLPSNCRNDAGAFTMENRRAWVAGRPLRGVVTPEIYDLAT